MIGRAEIPENLATVEEEPEEEYERAPYVEGQGIDSGNPLYLALAVIGLLLLLSACVWLAVLSGILRLT